MTLYVLRHGIAETIAPGGNDAARHLTPRGRAKMRAAAAGIRALGIPLDALLTSPLPRAAETAQIVATVVGKTPPPRTLPALAPGVAPAEVVRALKPFARDSHVMVVGHEPGLSELASLMLTGSTDALALRLKKGGCLAIELTSLVPPAGGVLRWLLTPRQLRRLRH